MLVLYCQNCQHELNCHKLYYSCPRCGKKYKIFITVKEIVVVKGGRDEV